MNLCRVKVKLRISSKHNIIYYIYMVLLTVDRISSSADGGSMSWPAMEIGEISPVVSTNSLIATRSRSPSFGSGDDCLSNRVVYQLSDHCFGVTRRFGWTVSAHSRAISSGGGTRPARTSDSSTNEFSQGFGPSSEAGRGRCGKSVLSIIDPVPSTTISP